MFTFSRPFHPATQVEDSKAVERAPEI